MVDQLDDPALLERARSGDSEALRVLLLGHAPALYDYLVRVTLDAGHARDALEETLRQAAREIPPRDNVREWVFGAARRASWAASPGPDGTDERFWRVDFQRLGGRPSETLDGAAREAWLAALALDRRQYAVLDLAIRQGFDDSALARMLGIDRESARTLSRRVGAAYQRSLGADGAPGQPSGEGVLSALVPVEAAEDVLQEAVGAALAGWSAGAWRRTPPAKGERTADPAAGSWSQRTLLRLGGLAACAAVLALAILWPPSPIAITRDRDGDGPLQAAAETSPTASATATATRTPGSRVIFVTPVPSTPTLTATPPEPSPTAPGVTSTSPTASPTASPTSTPTPPPATPTVTATPAPCLPRLESNIPSGSAPSLVLTSDAEASSFFFIYNLGCGELPFTTSVAAGAEWLSARPDSGKITGQSSPPNQYTVSVYVQPLNLPGTREGTFVGRVRVAGGGVAGVVEVAVRVVREGAVPSVSDVQACSLPSGELSVTTTASDDFGLVAVYVLDGATRANLASMVNGGGGSTTWVATVPAGTASVIVQAIDGANQARESSPVAPAACT